MNLEKYDMWDLVVMKTTTTEKKMDEQARCLAISNMHEICQSDNQKRM